MDTDALFVLAAIILGSLGAIVPFVLTRFRKLPDLPPDEPSPAEKRRAEAERQEAADIQNTHMARVDTDERNRQTEDWWTRARNRTDRANRRRRP